VQRFSTLLICVTLGTKDDGKGIKVQPEASDHHHY
jgi:hypothetical protein